MNKTILALAYKAGLKPFEMTSNVVGSTRNVAELAEKMLSGRNAYFDADYRKRFGTRVHAVECFASRLVLGVIESAQPEGSVNRIFRSVLFRADGEVIFSTDQHRMLDQNAAHVEMGYQAAILKDEEVLKGLIDKQIKVAQRSIDIGTKVLAELANEAQAP